jgi:hypothetical protein
VYLARKDEEVRVDIFSLTGGLLYCRIRAFEGDLVEFETIYQRDDGSERIGKPSRLPLDGFLELSFGRWYEGSSPPTAAPTRPRGQPVPLDPRKIGGTPRASQPPAAGEGGCVSRTE